jgi:toxin ParE1/3/4
LGEAWAVKLRYTPRANAELAEVLDYIAERSPQGARRVQMRIQAMTHLLLQYPYVGQLTDLETMRRIVTTPYPYFIFYEVTDDEIIVVGVRHSARDPSSMPDHQ